jgi:hypothetical protein
MLKTLSNSKLSWSWLPSNSITILKRLTCFVDNFIIKHVHRMPYAFTILYVEVLNFLLIHLTRQPTDAARGSNLGSRTPTGTNILKIYFGVIIENFSERAETLGHL